MALPRNVKLEFIKEDGKLAGNNKTTKTVSSEKGKQNGSLIHTVVYGDNLWNLAKKYLGSGKRFKIIYDANKTVIDEMVKRKGKSEHYKGYWIVPGMKLVIPTENTNTSDSGKNASDKNKTSKKKKEELAEYITDFSYTDVADGKSDSISLTLCDIKKEWLGKKRPKKGSRFKARLVLNNYSNKVKKNFFDCGSFTIDDISFSGRPLTCNMNGVNIPVSNDFKTLQKTKTWQKSTVKDIAAGIAKTAGVSLVYDADTVRIEEIEQNNEEDSSFLYSLCSKYGLGMKVYKQKIVIFDMARYEKKKEVAVINERDMLSWNANTTIEGTYTGVKFSYTNPVKNVKTTDKSKKGRKKKETIKVLIGKSGRLLYLNNQTSGKYDAELQAKAALNSANRKAETMSISLMGGRKLTSTQCIKIKGLKGLDGKYFIDEVNHRLGSSGYVMELSLHKVQKPF